MGRHTQKKGKCIDKTTRTFLNSTGSEHLLPEVVLVLSNRPQPLLDRPVLAHENVLGDLVEKSVVSLASGRQIIMRANVPEVVGHDNNTSRESVDGIGKRVDGGDIKTVGRLVQQQHVGALNGEKGEHNSRFLYTPSAFIQSKGHVAGNRRLLPLP